jgi:nucleoside-diphosphate-sugar epimerase
MRPYLTTVAVTGANGFIASEIIRQLLARGYNVVGTVRNIDDIAKTAHLRAFPGASRLRLQNADLMDSATFDGVVADADVVLHTASPLSGTTDTEEGYCGPAVSGTNNVLNSIARVGKRVRVVVLTSSIASISSNAGALPKTHVYSERDWSPEDRLRELKRYYALSKTLAERAAWDHALVTSGKVKLVTVCPGLVIGPITHPIHASGTAKRWLQFERGEWASTPNRGTVPVDVRDVARAHLRCFESPTANGRYACVWSEIPHQDIVDAYTRVFGSKTPRPPLDTSKPYEPLDLWDNTKCEQLIGGFLSLDETVSAMSESFARVLPK